MRETIIKCDHCGKVIKGYPYKIRLEQEDQDELICTDAEGNEEVSELDWCENCFRNLTDLLLDTSHQLFVNPSLKDANLCEVDTKFNTKSLAIGKYSGINRD